jgi:hypothetical protein
MPWRTKLGALLGAGGLILLAASTAIAAPPSYSISVLKSASPTSVPPSGGTVLFTVAVTGTGTGFFQQVTIDDGMAGCTLAGPTGDDADGKLEQGETWSYTCSVTNVHPNDANTAVVNACHNIGTCSNAAHDATGQSTVTMGTGAATEAPPTEAPPTEAPPTEAPPTEAPPTEAPPTEAPPTEAPPTEAPPTGAVPTGDNVDPSAGVGDLVDASEPATDTIFSSGNGSGPDRSILLVLSLGLLLASLVLITPARPVRARQRK